MSGIRTFLDKFFLMALRSNGVDLPARGAVNFLGGTVADNPDADSTDVTLGGGGGGGGIQFEDASGTLLPVRTKLQFLNGTIGDDPTNARSVYAAPTSAAAMPINGLFFSPADYGAAVGAGKAGDFTVGIEFCFLCACTWTGIRFNAAFAGSLLWKARAFDMTTPGTALATATSGPLTSGTNVVMFGAPIAIPNQARTYVASVYETTGSVYAGASYIGPPIGAIGQSTNGLGAIIGPKVVLGDNSFFFRGDGQPTSGGSSDRMAVEPIFTVP
jgi:hypothetical protein